MMWLVNPWVVVHAAGTWAMVGLIWTIQVLHYPLMAKVPGEGFPAYLEAHQQRVVVVLAIFSIVEVTAAAALAVRNQGIPTWLWLGSGALLAAIWIATGAYYAPLHGRLSDGWDPDLHAELVDMNWFRTIGWSARGVAAAAMLVLAARPSVGDATDPAAER